MKLEGRITYYFAKKGSSLNAREEHRGGHGRLHLRHAVPVTCRRGGRDPAEWASRQGCPSQAVALEGLRASMGLLWGLPSQQQGTSARGAAGRPARRLRLPNAPAVGVVKLEGAAGGVVVFDGEGQEVQAPLPLLVHDLRGRGEWQREAVWISRSRHMAALPGPRLIVQAQCPSLPRIEPPPRPFPAYLPAGLEPGIAPSRQLNLQLRRVDGRHGAGQRWQPAGLSLEVVRRNLGARAGRERAVESRGVPPGAGAQLACSVQRGGSRFEGAAAANAALWANPRVHAKLGMALPPGWTASGGQALPP